MTDCTRMRAYISAKLDGELTPEQTDELSAHLAACPDCAALDSALQSLHSLCAEEMAEPPAVLTQNVMSRIKTAEPPRAAGKKRRIVRIAAGFAAAAACLALVLISLPAVLGRTAANDCAAPAAAESAAADMDAADTGLDGLADSTRCQEPENQASGADNAGQSEKTADSSEPLESMPFYAAPQRAHTAEEFDCSILITIYGELPFDASACETAALDLDGAAAALITVDAAQAQALIDTGLYDYSVNRSAENDICMVLHLP